MKKGLVALIVLLAVVFIGVTIASAQGTEPPTPTFVGSQMCAGCHKTEHDNWAASLHPHMIQDPKAATATVILADFAKFTKVITNPKLKYDAKDVVYTIGWRYRQRYILKDAKTGRLVLGAGQWNIASQGPARSDNTWQNAAAGDDWLKSCAGCHTTGYDPQTEKYAELGIGCEACHGPASEHIKSPNKNTIPVNGSEALAADICGQCHTNGSSPEVDGKTYPYPISYTIGSQLTNKNFILAKPTGLVTDTNWWNDGHAKNYRQQYPEWINSGHANALKALQSSSDAADACLGCHSADYVAAASSGTNVVSPTLKTAQFGITCQVCHAPHQTSTKPFDSLLRNESYQLCVSCHNDTRSGKNPLKPGDTAHNPMQEMYEGKGALDVEGSPSPHFATLKTGGPTCTSCHMPGTATSADAGDIATHDWKIIMPGSAQPDEPNACSACHTNPDSGVTLQLDAAALQQMIDSRQTEIKDSIDTLTKQLKDLKSAHADWDPKAVEKSAQQASYEKALTNVSFVEAEGSYGIHNYAYAKAVLAQADEQLKAAAATPTPAPTNTPQPTTTPVPPTPIPAPTPIPPPSGGATWPIWVILFAVIVIVVTVLVVRSPKGTG